MGQYTDEQLKIINSKAKQIDVESPPGSGKTYCILGIVKKHKKDRHLILAFNANIRETIRKKIEQEDIHNAEVHTFHSLAYDFFKGNDQIANFENRKLENLDYFSLSNIIKDLGYNRSITRGMLEEIYLFLRCDATLNDFLSEKVDEFSEKFRAILKHIMDEPDAPMFHEFYIKMFQLVNYSTNMYDTILVDESQDKTSCYNRIIKNIGAKRVVHFGDNLQKIYAYNGAIGMSKSSFRLTKSFRVGREHSDICNSVVDFLLNSSVGFEGVNPNGIIVDSFSRKDNITIISRTNKSMMGRMLEQIKKGKVVHIVGGKESLGLSLIESIFTATPKKPFYYKKRKIKSIKDAINLYMESNSADLKRAIDFISDHAENTMKLVNTIRHSTIDSIELADVNLVTAHKSKGLEFENVEIDNDFPKMEALAEKRIIGKPIEGEVFALYVALSRSFGKLKLNRNLEDWYRNYKNDKINKPEVSYTALKNILL